MNLPNPPSRQDSQRWGTRLAELSVLASTTIAFLSIYGISRLVLVIVVVPLILMGITIILVMRRLYSVTIVPVTIAIGGPPGVGKTVYINVLCNQLMEERSKQLSFVPETQTAQRVYRTTRDLRKGEWPPQTGGDHIDYYRGTVAVNGRSFLSVLLNGRQEFKLELGDAAGQNWDRLADEADRRAEVRDDQSASVPRLIESTFFSYVGEASALFYFIDSEWILNSPFKVSECVDDLLSTVTLLRTTQRRGPTTLLARPISVVLSKIDTLTPANLEALLPLGKPDPIPDNYDDILRSYGQKIDREFTESVFHLVRLRTILERQAASYGFFLVSAIADASSARIPSTDSKSYLDFITRYTTERPLEWTFEDLWRRRRLSSISRSPW